MIYDILTGKEVKASGGTVTEESGITITDDKGIKYMVCSVAYGTTKVMQYDEYIKKNE